MRARYNRMILKEKIDPSKMKAQRGFTLIEMAIVILIGGIMMSLFASALLSYMKKNEIITTQYRLEQIQTALDRYLRVNGRYPCPSDRRLGPDDTNFGREVAANCNSGPFAGAPSDNGVRIGAVPVRELSIPDEFAVDAWQQKLTYAVTQNLARDGVFTEDGGRIIIRDGANNSLVTPANTAHYVILSHGRTGNGSFPLGASANRSVPCSANALDRNNCSDTRVFRSTLVNADVEGNRFFDDYVVFKGQTAPILTIPENAVMPFNLATCPDGWSPYNPARGRFVIGSQTGTKTVNRYTMTLSNPLQTSSFNLGVGSSSTNGDHEANIPPYVALLYCEKD